MEGATVILVHSRRKTEKMTWFNNFSSDLMIIFTRFGPSTNGGQSRSMPVYANVASVGTSTKEHANRVITDHDRDAVARLTDEQWRGVVKLLNAKDNSRNENKASTSETLTGTSSYSSWNLNTGASHHMTGKLELLTNLRDISPVLIILADGNERIAVQEGTAYLSSHLVLKSVFYVEGFQSDLVSVGQLMDENYCVAQLVPHFIVIVIQDRTTRMVTGVGKR